MSTVRNPYFSQGTASEQNLLEDIIIESLKIYGQELLYIPRVLVSKDDILGEDRLSRFVNAFPIEMYFENVDSFDGQGAFIQKFGLMMEQSATLVVARKRWEHLIGNYNTGILPNRPSEGDLIYFPLTKGLFEIKFVKHQDPFYQLGKLYTYKLQIELFQYASERLDTGNPEIDAFESLKTHEVDHQPDIDDADSFGDNNKFKQQGAGIVFNEDNPFGDVSSAVARSVHADSTTIETDSTNITADRNGI